MAEAGAQLIRDAIKADIAEQLESGGNVLYTAGGSSEFAGVARISQTDNTMTASSVLATDDGLFLDQADISLEPAEADGTPDD